VGQAAWYSSASLRTRCRNGRSLVKKGSVSAENQLCCATFDLLDSWPLGGWGFRHVNSYAGSGKHETFRPENKAAVGFGTQHPAGFILRVTDTNSESCVDVVEVVPRRAARLDLSSMFL